MNLDDVAGFRELDTQDMRGHIDSLPDQFEAAWERGKTYPVPEAFRQANRIVIVGMGSSALAGEMLAALLADSCKLPILVCRGYELPAYVDGPGNLVIIVSYSGDTEETLSALNEAQTRRASVLVVTANAGFAQQAEVNGAAVWMFEYEGHSRTALGLNFGLLLALVNRLGVAADLSGDITTAIEMLRERVPILGIEGRIVKNPAKRLAGQMVGRIPVVYGAGILAPVAHRWKTQLNENGKTWSEWDELPELNHNASAGINFPRPLMTKVSVVILSSPQYDHPRVALRQTLTKEMYLQQGIAVDVVKMRGNSRLAQMLSGVQYGDYVSYFVAMSYGVDPTPTLAMMQIKERMAAANEVTHDSHD